MAAEAIGLAASIASLISLSSQALKLVKTVKEGRQDRQSLRDEIRNIICLLEILSDRIDDFENNDVHFGATLRLLGSQVGPLAQMKETVELVVAKLVPSNKIARAVQPLTWPFNKKDALDILSKLEREKSLISLALESNHVQISLAMRDTLQTQSKRLETLTDQQDANLRRLDEEKRDTIISWLVPVLFTTTQSDVISNRTAGTALWLLSSPDYERWILGEQRCLWCPGNPGAGKTIIAASIIDNIQKTVVGDETKLAFVYFNHKEHETQTTVNIVGSVLRMLLRDMDLLPRSVLKAYKDHNQRSSRPSIEEYVEFLREAVSQSSRVYLVLDGLDECNDLNGSRSKSLDILDSLPQHVSLLYTSRRMKDLETRFQDWTSLEISPTRADMEKFLLSRIEEEPRLKRHVVKDETLRQEIVKTVIRRASGMFLLARLHIDSLASQRSCLAVRNALRSIPEGLDRTYDELMKRIDMQGETDAELARMVLSWVTFARTPLTLAEVRHAIAVHDLMPTFGNHFDTAALPDEDILLSVCAGVVVVDESNDVVHLVHLTLQEYFDRKGPQHFGNVALELALVSVNCLLFTELEIGEVEYFRDMDKQLEHLPLLGYAAMNWPHWVISACSKTKADDMGGLPLAIHNLLTTKAISTAAQVVVYIRTTMEDGRSSLRPIRYGPGQGGSSLFFAMTHRLYELVKGLINLRTEDCTADSGPEAQYVVDINANEDLQYAAVHGLTSVVELFSDRPELNVNAFSSTGSPLFLARLNGHGEVAQLLSNRGALLVPKAQSLSSFVARAARMGRVELLEDLLQETPTQESKDNALHVAATAEHLNALEVLLRSGAEINPKTIHHAASTGQVHVLRTLLDHGGDVNAMILDSEYPPLWLAIMNEQISTASLLIERGATFAEYRYLRSPDDHYRIGAGIPPRLNARCLAIRYGLHPVANLLRRRGATMEESDWNEIKKPIGPANSKLDWDAIGW